MNPLLSLCRHRACLHLKLSSVMLLAVLQRTPVVRVLQATERLVASSPLGIALRSAAATAASLGALHSLAGATTLVSSQPAPVNARVGTPITPVGFTVTDTINIGSWRIGGTFPPGLMFEATQGNATITAPGILDATTVGVDDGYGVSGGIITTTPILKGTPTLPGNYTLTLQAYEYGAVGGLASKSFAFTIVVAGAPARLSS